MAGRGEKEEAGKNEPHVLPMATHDSKMLQRRTTHIDPQSAILVRTTLVILFLFHPLLQVSNKKAPIKYFPKRQQLVHANLADICPDRRLRSYLPLLPLQQ